VRRSRRPGGAVELSRRAPLGRESQEVAEDSGLAIARGWRDRALQTRNLDGAGTGVVGDPPRWDVLDERLVGNHARTRPRRRSSSTMERLPSDRVKSK